MFVIVPGSFTDKRSVFPCNLCSHIQYVAPVQHAVLPHGYFDTFSKTGQRIDHLVAQYPSGK